MKQEEPTAVSSQMLSRFRSLCDGAFRCAASRSSTRDSSAGIPGETATANELIYRSRFTARYRGRRPHLGVASHQVARSEGSRRASRNAVRR